MGGSWKAKATVEMTTSEMTTSEMTTRLPCRMRFSHEVTTGISHGREPVVSKNVGRKVHKGRQTHEFTRLPVVLSGLKTTRRNLLHGLAPVANTYRNFVTQSHSNCGRRFFTVPRCFHAKTLHSVGLRPKHPSSGRVKNTVADDKSSSIGREPGVLKN